MAGFIASQPQWNLAKPNPAADPTMVFLSPADEAWHHAHNFPVVAYSAAARGYFASAGRLAANEYDNPTSRARLKRAAELAVQFGVSPNQIALAYLLSQPFPVIPILGTADREHLQDAVRATAVPLTQDQIDWLRDDAV